MKEISVTLKFDDTSDSELLLSFYEIVVNDSEEIFPENVPWLFDRVLEAVNYYYQNNKVLDDFSSLQKDVLELYENRLEEIRKK